MRTSATLEAPCPTDVLFAHVDSLDRYPEWMSLVHRAAVSDPGDDGLAAWSVELRTKVGPLARSKRLRMVRTELDPARRVRFERRELDERRHAPWLLVATVEPVMPGAGAGETAGAGAVGSRLTMELEYGGSLWTGGVLQRILDDEIRRGSERLLELVRGAPTR